MKRINQQRLPLVNKQLTSRQIEIYELREKGLTFTEIALKLNITKSAVRDCYVRAVRKKRLQSDI